jgi:hypothetical protein
MWTIPSYVNFISIEFLGRIPFILSAAAGPTVIAPLSPLPIREI